MDDTCDLFHLGRVSMRNAFAAMSGLACRLGASEVVITELHGQFFDGHVQVKDAFRSAVLLARLYEAGVGVTDESHAHRDRT